MSAALLTIESIVEGVRRLLAERLEDARKALERQPLSDENVHTIRKDLKRARASLRLLRDALGDSEYRRLNRSVRDAARPLTPLRDANVLLQALDKIVESTTEFSGDSIYNGLRQSLQQQLRLNRAQLKSKDIAAIRSSLKTVKLSVQDVASARLDRAAVDEAIKRTHKRACKAYKAVKREPSDENLHEWRKQVKYEFNQLELLQILDPECISRSIRKVHKLSDHLGDDHDLAILHARIATQSKQAKTAGAVADADALLKTLKSMRTKLQCKAHRLGKPLYGKKSKQRNRKSLVIRRNL